MTDKLYVVVTLWQGLYDGVKAFASRKERNEWYRSAVREETEMPDAPWTEVEREYDDMMQFGRKFNEYYRDTIIK